MAADWIKMRSNLDTDPDVIAIAAQLGIDEFAVVGRLHKFWAWADQHSLAGTLPRLTPAWIDRFVSCQGFSAALEQIGWLVVKHDSIILPGWERHNGSSAKSRAGEAVRKQLQRSAQKCPEECPDICPPGEEGLDGKNKSQGKVTPHKSLLESDATGIKAKKQAHISICPEECPESCPDNHLDQRRVEKSRIPTYLPEQNSADEEEWIETLQHRFPDRDVEGELKAFQSHCQQKGTMPNRVGFTGWLKRSSPAIREETQLRYSY